MDDLAQAAVAATNPSLLFVDDEPNILSSLRRLFRPLGYRVAVAGSGEEGLEYLGNHAVDLVISDMRMPEMDGAQFLDAVRQRWPDTIRILLTGYADIESTVNAINKGEIFRYVSKPWNDQDILLIVRHALERKGLEREKERLEALTARQNEELKALNAGLELKVQERTQEVRGAHEKLKTSFLTSIKVFANLIELRGSFLAGHSRRVADLARRIASYMKLESAEGQDVFLAGLLHDIGKIGLPDDLLSKPVSQFTGSELGQYRKHPVKGEQSLMALDELHGAAEMLRAHHERFDGQGFPDGLSGDAIPVGARILAVANDYDAVQIGNLFARRLSPEEARKFIVGGRGHRYDPAVVEAFLGVAGEPESHAQPAAERRMTPSMLEPGMKLTRDFVTREGVLLLSADHVLSPGLIRQIQDYARSEGELIALYVR